MTIMKTFGVKDDRKLQRWPQRCHQCVSSDMMMRRRSLWAEIQYKWIAWNSISIITYNIRFVRHSRRLHTVIPNHGQGEPIRGEKEVVVNIEVTCPTLTPKHLPSSEECLQMGWILLQNLHSIKKQGFRFGVVNKDPPSNLFDPPFESDLCSAYLIAVSGGIPPLLQF